jgi:hypothetical protein
MQRTCLGYRYNVQVFKKNNKKSRDQRYVIVVGDARRAYQTGETMVTTKKGTKKAQHTGEGMK